MDWGHGVLFLRSLLHKKHCNSGEKEVAVPIKLMQQNWCSASQDCQVQHHAYVNSAVTILRFLLLVEQRACVFILHWASQITQPGLITKRRDAAPLFLVYTNEETCIQRQNGWPCNSSRNLNGLRWEWAQKIFFPALKENDFKNWLQIFMMVSAGEEEKGRWQAAILLWYWYSDPNLPEEPNWHPPVNVESHFGSRHMCIACRDTHICSLTRAFGVGKLMIYLIYPYKMLKKNTKTIVGGGGCF